MGWKKVKLLESELDGSQKSSGRSFRLLYLMCEGHSHSTVRHRSSSVLGVTQRSLVAPAGQL